MGHPIKAKYVVKAKISHFYNGKLITDWQIIGRGQSKKECHLNAKKHRDDYNESLKKGGVNAHLRSSDGSIPFASDCYIWNQFINAEVDRYTAPMFECV